MKRTSCRGFLCKTKVNYPGPFTFCYIDDRVSIAYYFDYVDPIYPIELTVNKTSDKVTTASYFDQYREPIMNKREDFSFHIVNFPIICSNILVALGYEVSISQ